jgi:hypothetical protein
MPSATVRKMGVFDRAADATGGAAGSDAGAASGARRITTTTKRSYFSRMSRAISNSSNVRHDARIAFTNAEKPVSSG